MRDKVGEDFGHIASSFADKIDVVSDELLNRIYKIRNRQDEVRAI